jgi:molybdopterin converting factor subunit 1
MINMTINVLTFGIAKEIMGSAMVNIELHEPGSVGDLKILLENEFPALKKLGSYMIAVNNGYAEGQTVIHANDEVAVIPPVSGG